MKEFVINKVKNILQFFDGGSISGLIEEVMFEMLY